MKKQRKKILYGMGFLGLTLVFVACSAEPIVIGETNPTGLLDTLLVYPISWLINTIFTWTKNGGVAIMVTTIIINIITSPLEIFSQVETKKQQEIQPQLKELQEKYPDNRTDPTQQQKFFREQQTLYAENGMSIFGMCLPMLLILFIQMPILTAIFGAVRRLTILNQASFSLFGVMYSYGHADPGIPYIPYIGSWLRLFIFGAMIAIFVSQYFSLPKGQRNPKENQQAMQMYLMNGIMMIFFWNQPIALAIYWIVSNLTRLFFRLTIVNVIVNKQHQKFQQEKREKKAKRYK